MESEKYFNLMQQLKSLSRVSFMGFINENAPDLPSSIFAWLFEKSIDLVDGIVQLHKSNLDECSQSLIRVLFETYLKFIHIQKMMRLINQEEVSLFVLESMILLKEKSTVEQDKAIPNGALTRELGHNIDLNSIKEKYKDDSNPFVIMLRQNNFLGPKSCCLKSIKKNSFLLDNIENIAQKYHKRAEYQMMYRNFSRNVHANDFHEYVLKQGHIEDDGLIETRNIAAFNLVLRIFIEIVTNMNYLFDLHMKVQLEEILKEYNKLE